MAKKPISFVLNGAQTSVFVEQGGNLLDELRRNIGDLSSKYGCGQGTCGACTVLIDGEPQLSCLVLAERVAGKTITTNNGLAQGPQLHPAAAGICRRLCSTVWLLYLRHVGSCKGIARS